MSEEPQLNGDIEELKSGDFAARANWFHREFSNDIEGAVKTGQELMYFWAVARSYFKAWLFKQVGKPVACANLVKSAEEIERSGIQGLSLKVESMFSKLLFAGLFDKDCPAPYERY